MVVGVPEKSGNGPATLTSGAEKGQAVRRRSAARAAAATVRSADSVAGAAQLACVLEVSAEKPGNITPSHDFRDTSYEDMLRSAIAVGPELGARGRARGGRDGAGGRAGVAPRRAGEHEPRDRAAARAAGEGGAEPAGPLRARLAATLRALDLADARAAYAAIRLAGAGGLDERVEHDVRSEPTVGLREAMASAAGARLDRLGVRDRLRADLRDRDPGARRRARRRARRARGDRRAAPAAAGPGAGHADRPQARRRRGGAGVGGRARGARRRRRAHRRGARALRSFDASLREPRQRAEPRHDRRPRDGDAVRRAGRGYARRRRTA